MRQLFALCYAAAGPLGGTALAVIDAADHLGAYPVTAGAAVASGKSVTADAQGRAVQAAATAGTPVYCVGVSKQAATAAGDEIEIILAPHVLAG